MYVIQIFLLAWSIIDKYMMVIERKRGVLVSILCCNITALLNGLSVNLRFIVLLAGTWLSSTERGFTASALYWCCLRSGCPCSRYRNPLTLTCDHLPIICVQWHAYAEAAQIWKHYMNSKLRFQINWSFCVGFIVWGNVILCCVPSFMLVSV